MVGTCITSDFGGEGTYIPSVVAKSVPVLSAGEVKLRAFFKFSRMHFEQISKGKMLRGIP